MAFLLLCSALLLGTAAYINPYNTGGSHGGVASAGATTHLHFYMDDFYTGLHPTAIRVVSGRSLSPNNGSGSTAPAPSPSPPPRQFGDIVVLDDPLTQGPGCGSARVGKAQGFVVRVSEDGVVSDLSLHLFLEAGEYRGSSVTVKGRIDLDSAVRESVVVGGTGRFRFARGYMLTRSYDYDLARGGVVEIDVYVQQ